MPHLTIVANIVTKPHAIETVKAAALALIPPTRVEPGCVSYHLHQDNDNAAHLMFVEVWESRELWQTHMGAPHLAAYSAATEGLVEEFVLSEMTLVD